MLQIVCLALGIVLAAFGVRAQPSFLDSTPGQLPKTVVPHAYAIDLKTDFERATLTGHVDITIEVREATDSVILNQAGLNLAGATLEDGSSATISEDAHAQTATLKFATPLAVGPHALAIDYSGRIPQTPAGIYFDDYKTVAGPSRRMLVTQFEAADARRMVPCWDEPAFKATFQLSVTLPDNLAAVSNMPAEATVAVGSGLSQVKFGTTPPMATYLLALIAGDMAAVNGNAGSTAVNVWAPTGQQGRGAYAMQAATALLPYYNAYFGVAYPLPKLDLLAIPGNFSAGAMENWGAITYVDNALLFDPANSAPRTQETVYVVVAHEMAHQWSGDLVTMAWWNDLWLNEGFATWMQVKATDHFNPAWQMWARAHGAHEEAMAQDALPTTHPIEQPIRDISEAGTAFDRISYQKGSAVIRMVEDWLGPDVFRDGMRAYMQAHAYGNTTSADLWRALEEVSHQDVAEVAAGFTRQPGIPLVHAASRCEGSTNLVTLTQDRFTIHDPNASALTWRIPVTIGVPGAGGAQRLVLGADPVTLRFTGCGPAVKANLGEDGYYRTHYDDATLAGLVASPALPDVDRANLLGDQFALFEAGRAPLQQYLGLVSSLPEGLQSVAVWDDTIGHLTRLDGLLHGSPQRPAFRRIAAGILRPALARLGWDAQPGEPFVDGLLRPGLIAALGRFDDADTVAEARRRFDRFLADPASLPAGLQDAVATIVGARADAATWAQLQALGETAPDTEHKLRWFYGMAGAPDPALIERTVQFASSGSVPNGRIVRVLASAAVQTEDYQRVWDLVQQNQAALRAHLSEGAQPYLLPSLLGGATDPALAAALLADPASHASVGARVSAARAAEQVGANADLRQRAEAALAAWLPQQP